MRCFQGKSDSGGRVSHEGRLAAAAEHRDRDPRDERDNRNKEPVSAPFLCPWSLCCPCRPLDEEPPPYVGEAR